MLSRLIKRAASKMTEELKSGEFGQTLKDNARKIEELARRRFFVRPSFEIYGGVGGLFDYGPPGCAVKREIEALWRRHFVLEEDMLEIQGPSLTPENVLTASGHVERFSDFMIKDPTNDNVYRADKEIEKHVDTLLADPNCENRDYLERVRIEAGAYNADELHAKI
jgi:glycyl-tRNA synthetase